MSMGMPIHTSTCHRVPSQDATANSSTHSRPGAAWNWWSQPQRLSSLLPCYPLSSVLVESGFFASWKSGNDSPLSMMVTHPTVAPIGVVLFHVGPQERPLNNPLELAILFVRPVWSGSPEQLLGCCSWLRCSWSWCCWCGLHGLSSSGSGLSRSPPPRRLSRV